MLRLLRACIALRVDLAPSGASPFYRLSLITSVRHQVATNERAFATNPTLAARLGDRQAYQLSTKALLDSLEPSDSVVQ
jgi:hypothetical protein